MGYMNSLEWSGGMERWNGAVEWTSGLEYWRDVVNYDSLRMCARGLHPVAWLLVFHSLGGVYYHCNMPCIQARCPAFSPELLQIPAFIAAQLYQRTSSISHGAYHARKSTFKRSVSYTFIFITYIIILEWCDIQSFSILCIYTWSTGA